MPSGIFISCGLSQPALPWILAVVGQLASFALSATLVASSVIRVLCALDKFSPLDG